MLCYAYLLNNPCAGFRPASTLYLWCLYSTLLETPIKKIFSTIWFLHRRHGCPLRRHQLNAAANWQFRIVTFFVMCFWCCDFQALFTALFSGARKLDILISNYQVLVCNLGEVTRRIALELCFVLMHPSTH